MTSKESQSQNQQSPKGVFVKLLVGACGVAVVAAVLAGAVLVLGYLGKKMFDLQNSIPSVASSKRDLWSDVAVNSKLWARQTFADGRCSVEFPGLIERRVRLRSDIGRYQEKCANEKYMLAISELPTQVGNMTPEQQQSVLLDKQFACIPGIEATYEQRLSRPVLCNGVNGQSFEIRESELVALIRIFVVSRHLFVVAATKTATNSKPFSKQDGEFHASNESDLLRFVESFELYVPEAIEKLTEALSAQDAESRATAAHTISKLGKDAKSALPLLMELLEDADAEVRRNAAAAIESLAPDGTEAIPKLAKLLADPQADVRVAAAGAIGAFGPKASEVVEELIRCHRDDKDSGVVLSCSLALADIGKPSVPHLIDELGNSRPDVRNRTAFILGKIGAAAHDAIPNLIELLADDDSVRGIAAEAILRIGPREEALETLIPHLESEDPEVRGMVALTVSKIRNAAGRALSKIRELLDDENPRMRRDAVMAIGNFGSEAYQCIAAVKVRLEDEDQQVRRSAVYALSEISSDSTDVLPHLTTALDDEDPGVRSAAAVAIGHFGPAATDLVPKLIRLLDDNSTQLSAAGALGSIGPGAASAGSSLIACAKNSKNFVVISECWQALAKIGAPAIPTVIAALDDQEQQIRNNAIVLAGKSGARAKAAVPKLIQLLDHTDSEVRAIAAEAIGRIGADPKGAVPKLIACLDDEVAEVRANAAAALARFGPDAKTALPLLRNLLDDWNANARREAARAIKLIVPPDR